MSEENEEAFALELNEEAIEAAVDRAADRLEDPSEEGASYYNQLAHDVGLDLPEFMHRVANELEARGS
jgi:hypothetical protein